MARNTIDDRSKDIAWGFNKTQQTKLKFQVMPETFTRRFELAQGLTMFKLSMSIRLNAYYKLAMNDEIEIKGKKFRVTTISDAYDDNLQAQYKATFDDYTGYRVVGLE